MIYSGQMWWFMGVVEDRDDPEELGRVKVRCLGIHPKDLSVLPTEDLPWATPLMPFTSASLGTVGQSATGIVEGSWVVGFFTDGQEMQQPVVMGTVPSRTGEEEDFGGFRDLTGTNPLVRQYNNDQPMSATENFKYNRNYYQRLDYRQEDVETAVPPRVTSVAEDDDDQYYERLTWSSPEVHNGEEPAYPFNKVNATEGGHVFEIDDTPGAERIATFHTSGTNFEWLDNGDETTTIVGNQYEVVLGSTNIYVRGNVNMTVDGNFKQLVKGDYHLEVDGDKTENIKGSRQSKITGSEHTEIGQDFSSNVTVDYSQRVGGMETRIVDSDRKTTIGGDDDWTINRNSSKVVMGKYDEIVIGDHSTTTTGKMNITSELDMTIETPANQITNIDGFHDLNVVGVSRMDAQFMFLNDQDATPSHPGGTGDGAAARVGDRADEGDAGTGSHFDVNSAGTDDIISGSATVYIGG